MNVEIDGIKVGTTDEIVFQEKDDKDQYLRLYKGWRGTLSPYWHLYK